MDKTLLQKLDEVPPFFCAVWCREKARGKMAGPRIISKRSGIPYRTVQRISAQITWAGVDAAVVSAFFEACGIRMPKGNIVLMNHLRSYMRWAATKAVRPFHHLDDFHYKLFSERSKKWLEAQGKSK